MEATSTQKFVKMAPRKLRLVADMVRGKGVSEALEFLPFVSKNAAKPVEKVIKSALANAQTKGADVSELKISSIEVMEGPRLKRFRAVSRGQAHGYVRQMSHIKVSVSTVDSQQTTAKRQSQKALKNSGGTEKKSSKEKKGDK